MKATEYKNSIILQVQRFQYIWLWCFIENILRQKGVIVTRPCWWRKHGDKREWKEWKHLFQYNDCIRIQDSLLKLVSQEFWENIVPLHYLMMRLLVISIFLKLVATAPYEPGQPGGEWTAEEIDIVRGKVIPYFSILS